MPRKKKGKGRVGIGLKVTPQNMNRQERGKTGDIPCEAVMFQREWAYISARFLVCVNKYFQLGNIGQSKEKKS